MLSIGADRFDNNQRARRSIVGARQRSDRRRRGLVHWRRFHVPITVAAGAAAVAGCSVAIVVGIVSLGDAESAKNLILGFVLLLGIGMFLFAMWWDASDRARVTRRSDVAFWLHLLAAPMIVHPVFTLLGLNNGAVSVGEGLVVVAALRRCSA